MMKRERSWSSRRWSGDNWVCCVSSFLLLLILLDETNGFANIERIRPFSSLSTTRHFGVPQKSRKPPRHEETITSTTPIYDFKKLEQDVVTSGRRGFTDRAISIYDSIPQPTVRLWNNVIDACSRARPTRLDKAFSLFHEGITTKGLEPNVFTFGALMSACARARDVERALTILQTMQDEYGVQPNGVVYSSAISACSHVIPAKWETALSLLEEAEQNGVKMNIVGYNTALSACAKAAQMDQAAKLLEKMEAKGLVDDVSYGTILSACEQCQEWDLLLDYANRISKESNFTMDGLAITSVLHACQQLGLADEAVYYLDLMKSLPPHVARKTAGWERKGARQPLEGPDAVAYRLAISACARGGEWERGIELLDEMKQEIGRADVMAYTAAIAGCEKVGEWRRAFMLLRDMKSQDGIEPNEVTMAAVISACATACAKNGPDKQLAFTRGVEMLHVLQRDPSVVDPNIVVYNAAIRTCAEAGHLAKAFDLFAQARKQGLVPTAVTFGSLMTACERVEDFSGLNRVFLLMKEAGVKPNQVIYGAAMSCCRKSGHANVALLLLRKMIQQGLQDINVATYNTVLMAQTDKGDAKGAMEVYNLMLQDPMAVPNNQTHGVLVRSLCATGHADEAEKVIRTMQENGIKPDVRLYTMTVTAFERAGKPMKALQLMESMNQNGYDFYEIKILNSALKNAVRLVNRVGETLSKSGEEQPATVNATGAEAGSIA